MEEFIQMLNPMAQNYLKPDTPVHLKQIAASGKIPLPPQQQILLIYLLAQDSSAEIREKALGTFRTLPNPHFQSLLSEPSTHSALLDFIALQFQDNEDFIKTVILHKKTADSTFSWLAKSTTLPSILELISQNQQRQKRSHTITQNLLQNKHLNKTDRSRTIEFSLREDIETGLTDAQIKPFLSEGLMNELLKSILEEETTLPDHIVNDKPEAIETPGKKTETPIPKQEAEPEEKLSLEQEIANWSIAQKVKAGMKGNKAVRKLLIRDSNRLVCTAVMKNPRITESEIIGISANRGVSDDVIREITRNREWMKNYNIKLNLTNNPKCPTPTAMRLLNHLHLSDLKFVAKNKGVPSVVAKTAKKIFKTRSG